MVQYGMSCFKAHRQPDHFHWQWWFHTILCTVNCKMMLNRKLTWMPLITETWPNAFHHKVRSRQNCHKTQLLTSHSTKILAIQTWHIIYHILLNQLWCRFLHIHQCLSKCFRRLEDCLYLYIIIRFLGDLYTSTYLVANLMDMLWHVLI